MYIVYFKEPPDDRKSSEEWALRAPFAADASVMFYSRNGLPPKGTSSSNFEKNQ